MRKELELIQKIEHYLQGTMAGEDRIAFENEIANNAALQEEVELQKHLMKGMQRTIWRQDAQTAFAKYTFMQKLLKWAYIGTSVVIISLGIGYLMTQNKPSKENSTVAQTTLADTLANTNNLSDTESIYNILNGNSFVINSSRDTIVKTKDGKLIEIPKELFMDTMFVSNEDSTLAGKIVSGEVTQAKIYTLHFYSPNFPDTLKKWKQAIKDKNYSKAVRSFISSSNPKNYIKTSSKKQDIQKTDSIQTSKERDTIYQVVCGLNMEKIKTDASSNSKSPLYKLKGKIPFINKPSKNKNTIFVFDVDNKNKTSIDTATVIEVVDKLKDKAIITKKEK